MHMHAIRLVRLMVFVWPPRTGAYSFARYTHPWVTKAVSAPYKTAVPRCSLGGNRLALEQYPDAVSSTLLKGLHKIDKHGVAIAGILCALAVKVNVIYLHV